MVYEMKIEAKKNRYLFVEVCLMKQLTSYEINWTEVVEFRTCLHVEGCTRSFCSK
jgi:hypothetical protein